MLALLALAAGRVVPVPALIDALWGEQLPANPGNALQVRVSKLRRVLTAAGLGDVLLTRPPGYLLDVDPLSVDALRFADLVATARAAAGIDPETAARRYREALALWRGTPLAEFAETRWAGPEAARLTQLQLAARVELIDVELAAGRHTEVLSELEALTAAHPLHEPLHGRLMLALYRAGRQADALAAYQQAREVLDAELGLTPGAELRDLQEAILRQDPRLGPPARRRDAGRIPAAGAVTDATGAAAAAPTDVVPRPRRRPAPGRRAAAAPRGWSPSPARAASGRPASRWRPHGPPRTASTTGSRSCGSPVSPIRSRFRRPCWPRWRSGTWPRRPRRTSCSATCVTAPSCSCSTTASTSPTPARCSPSSCSSPARACGFWPPAASRSPPAARSRARSIRCPSHPRQPTWRS